MKSVSSVLPDAGHRFTTDLVDEFLAHRTYQHAFCLKLFALGKNPSMSWDIRRLAILMAENQILRLQPANLEAFDELLAELRLKRPGLDHPIASSALREGYSTTAFRGFVIEFLRRLGRNNRVHQAIRRPRPRDAAVREFIEHSRRDCKLTLARYLFTPDDVMREVLRHVTVAEGVRDVDVSQPRFIDAEIAHNLALLPDYEAGILQRLCAGAKVYWVAPHTSSAINSLVEYPLSTVVLVIKPPGSDIEFELKRAGRKGGNALSVVFKRNGRNVPASHRLDGGSMQWLLRYEARSGSKMSSIFRLVHRVDAPLPGYLARNTVYAVPTGNNGSAAPAFRYFTEPHVFGAARFREMRAAMKEAVKVFERDEGENLPAVGGDMGMTAEFLSHVAPAQAILCGTSSFRVDKVAAYLSTEGPEKYFGSREGVVGNGTSRGYTAEDARRFADELLDEVLGVYVSPSGRFGSYGRYVDAAFAVAANRARANEIFLSLVGQIAEFWGTMLGVRGQSRGESFVGRNVGIRSVWVDGQWRVKLIFMDHDALTLPDHEIGHFFAQNSLPGMLLDERHTWGKANPALFPTSLVGYLIDIYRIDALLAAEAEGVASRELLRAYKKTQHAVLTDRRLRAFVSDVFVNRLLDWDEFVAGFLRGDHQRSGWKKTMKKLFAAKAYEPDAFDYYLEACKKYEAFLKRNAFLYGA